MPHSRFHLAPLTLAVVVEIATFSTLPAHAQQTAAQAGTIHITISAQPLGAALNALARQADVQLMVHPDLVTGLNAPAVSGNMTSRQAFDRLLAGSGLVASVEGNTVIIKALASGKSATTLPAVLVAASAQKETATGPVIGYAAKRSATTTKNDTSLLETPQSISVVTREQMDAQNIQSVPQALRYTPGIVAEQRGVNTDALEYIYTRGFQIDEYWNGLRLPSNGFNITSMDPYLFERIELLRGPASVLYGQTSPGGLLSLVSKRPTDTPLHEIMFQTGSHGRAQIGADFGGPLSDDGKWSYRLTANAYDTGTQTDHIKQQHAAVAAALTYKPSADTHLTIFTNYQKDPQAGVFNYVPAAGTVLPGKVSVPRSFFAGDPDFNAYSKEQASGGYEFEHRFNETYTVKQNFRLLRNSVHIRDLDTTYGLSPDGLAIEREAYAHDGSATSVALDNQLQASFKTGSLDHKVTVGLDYMRLHYDHTYIGQGDALAPPINIANPVYGQTISYPDFMYGSSTDDVIKQTGVYLQDQIRLDRWAFLLGGRQDWASTDSESYKTGVTTRQSNKAFTWRTGLVYLFDNGISPYASYATSFQPALGTDVNGATFKPTKGQQYEVGIKYQPVGSDSTITVAAFDLTQTNVLTTDPLNSKFKVQTGEVRSQGVEVEARGALTKHLQGIATYTHTDIQNTRSNTNNLDKAPVGIPADMASLWLIYDVQTAALSGLQVGGGVRYVGASYGDATNTFKVPSYTLLDLSLRYDLGRLSSSLRGWTGTLTASNITNKNYIAGCINSSGCIFGAERAVLANVKYQW